jgi:predicted nuclease of predicted toxin-antitoxin system
MRFLVDANMPRSTLALLDGFGHTSEHARDIGLGHAPDSQIAACARSTGAALITRDLDFADIRNYPPADYQGILVLRMPDDAVAQAILNLLERFLKQAELAAKLPSHLVILEPDRVRFRPALQPLSGTDPKI